MRGKDYFEAYIDGYDKVVVYMSKQSYEGKSSRFFPEGQQRTGSLILRFAQ